MLAAEREQNEIDASLDHIEQQQKELAATLDVYEKSSEEILGRQGGGLRALDAGPADTERDKKYELFFVTPHTIHHFPPVIHLPLNYILTSTIYRPHLLR